ncbi:MAG: hypothetical protein ACUVQF_02290 [Fervidobacterium sp.]|uniref:hypothetical protein n=1 Tax=Fervidobacterium sp. TaxID=1871331 RepID=UPI00404AF6A4
MLAVRSKRIIVFLMFILFVTTIFADSDILDLVHKDYDFVVRVSQAGTWYDEIKKVPFFSFILGRKGLGFEDSFIRILEDMRYKTGVLPSVVQDAISKDIIFASKGIDINFSEIISFDLNFYFEFVKSIAANSFLAFQTNNPSQLVKALSFLLSVSYKSLGNNQYILGDSLYCGFTGKYLVVAGSKTALELSLKTSKTQDMQLSRTTKVFDRLKAGTFLISGYAKPNVVKINLPGIAQLDTEGSEYVLFYSTVSAGSFYATFEQKNKKEANSKKASENIGNIPLAWNYYLSIPAGNTDEVINSISQWFQGTSNDMNRFLDFVSSLSKSSANLYTVGRIESGDFLFIFDNYNGKNFETSVTKIGGIYDNQKQEWVLNLQNNIKLYIYNISNRVFIGTSERAKYEMYEKNRTKFKDFPAYFDFSKILTYEFKLFIDISDIIKSTIGFNVPSKMLMWKYNSGYFSYYKIVIS